MNCRLCASRLEPFISFGRMPVANGFLPREAFAEEFFFDLEAAFCERCAMPQLVESVPREKMFNDHYPFFTSSSARMAAHFKVFAASVMRNLPGDDPFVVEVGSNDGTLLRHFAAAGVRHLGVEPSLNVAAVAETRGVRTLPRFFDEDVAQAIVRDEGPADVILAANCFCHIQELDALAAAAHRMLKPGGLMIFEDPYLGDVIKNVAYDQIYDEHMFYFGVAGVRRWLERHDLEVVDVAPQPVHGGSMRYTVARQGTRRREASVLMQLASEGRTGLHRGDTYEEFRIRVERSREELVAMLRQFSRDAKRVVGYGATSKSTTVLNYCGITPDLVEFISDTTPLKQGRFSPGMHIPVLSHDEFALRFPDYALLFAWNHAAEIMQKERRFRGAGGRWLTYVPEVKVSD